MPTPLVFVIALGVLIVESVALELLSIQSWTLQTPLVLAIYLGLDRDFVAGGLVLGGLLFPVEWLVGGVYGAYSLGLVVVFLALRGLRPRLQSVWGVARGVVAAVAALVHAGVMMVALFLIGEAGSRVSAAVVWQLGMSAVVVAVAAVIMGKGFARVDAMMDPRSDAVQLDR